MTFATFTISELSEDHDDDYQVELTSSGNLHGFQVKEEELAMLGDAFIDATDQDAGVVDDRTVQEFVEADQNE